MNTVTVHNVYTLYELDSDGMRTYRPILSFFRPQDWGDSGRWHYHTCSIAFSHSGTTYINNCHVYQEMDRDPVEAFQLIAEHLFMVALPGTPLEIAGKSHLKEDDFWDEAWGDLPPYYEPDDIFEEDYSPPDELG